MLATLKDILLDVYYNQVPKNDENGSKMSTKHPLNILNQNVNGEYADKANVTNKEKIYDKSNNYNNNDSTKVDLNTLNANSAVSQLSDQGLFVGPYKLEKTLGKGQTGLVKLAVHCVTSKKMAIKIVNKEKLSESVLQKVEREIAIMKLIEHPHVLHLYEVYENKKYLYLVLEYVGNGELFDYLVRKGRLSPKEARKFFRQIISALDFCHAHNICHRDLKPENLLLDERYNIKVADFGMASLQVEGTMLETSCGSPHYACPEVIRISNLKPNTSAWLHIFKCFSYSKGEKYDGKKADVWSVGVILYALLVGALPFDDDNLRHLLEKVKKGVFHIPHFVPPDCQGLLRAMIEVDATKRLSLADVFRHSWVTGNIRNDSVERELPMSLIVQTHIIPNEDNIDPDVFRHMNSLGCFKDKEKLKSELLNSRHNTEKMVYFLLLDRKRRKPTFDDETTVFLKSGSIFDPPRKRIDTAKATKYSLGSISDGSPINPRKTYGRLRYSSSNGSPYVSPMPVAKNSTFCARSSYKIAPSFNYFTTSSAQASPKPEHSSNFTSHDPKSHNNNNNTYSFKDIQATVERKLSSDLIPTQSADTTGKSSVVKSTPPTSPLSQRSKWRSRFSSLKSSILTGTPRYHRKKSGDTDVSDSEDGSVFDTTDLVKKSWFDSLASSFSSDKDEMILFTVNKKSLNAVKAELIRAFLAVHELNHTIVDHNSFRLEFRKANVSSTTSMFIRTVRITVQIVPAVGKEDLNDRKVSKPFNVHFILISGSLRRFKRLVEHLIVLIKSFDHSPRSSDQPSDQKFACMVRPRKLSDASFDSTTSPDVTSAVLSPGILSPLSTDQVRNHRIISTSRLEASNENSQCTVMINRWATTRESIISSKSPDDQSINFRLKTERYKYQSPHPPPMDQSDLADDVRRTPSNERRKYQQQSHKPIVEKISTPLLGRRIFPENNGLRAKVQPFSSLS